MKAVKEKVLVGLSGGVDSAVCLYLLKKQGYSPIGVFLDFSQCSNQEQKESVKRICSLLSVPYFIHKCSGEFKNIVLKYFKDSYRKGHTPNPCVFCNRYFKFELLRTLASQRKIKYIATGHYVRLKKGRKVNKILIAKDKAKDQSYFLCLLNQKLLKRAIFPLGNLKKEQVKDIAKKIGFLKKDYKESQNLCFLGEKLISHYLSLILGEKPGNIVNEKGGVLGSHKGLHFYTLGQRKGIHLSKGPFWVVGFDYKNNNLIVSKNKNLLFKKEVIVSPYNFIFFKKFPRKKFIQVKAKLRSQSALSLANLYFLSKKELKLVFKNPQKAPTPGQFAVFYKNNLCLGGGVIFSAH